MSADGRAPVASVIIPAHNEETVIGRCLTALLAEEHEICLDVIVVCNGCTDATAALAGQIPGVRVLDTATASKSLALNMGDDTARAFPRIFLDADIVLSHGALRALIAALSVPDARVAAPQVHFDTSRSSWGVRAYYTAFTALPYASEGLVGLGVYGVSEAGRARFDRFPAVQADDLFIQRLFQPTERITTSGTFTVQAPRDVRNLWRVRTRVARGNRELSAAMSTTTNTARTNFAQSDGANFQSSTRATASALLRWSGTNPTRLASGVVYVLVTAAARLAATRRARGRNIWERDDSSRVVIAEDESTPRTENHMPGSAHPSQGGAA